MKKLMVLTIAIVLLFAVTAVQAEDAKWFDMENCEMCKGITSQEGLMENMQWEQHKISNGVMSVCNVPKDFMEALAKADAAMEATGAKLGAGEKLNICGSCMTLGSLFPKGLNHEKVKTSSGCIDIFSSADEAIVTELHTWAEKNAVEMAKMMAAMEAAEKK